MRLINYIILLISFSAFGQNQIDVKIVDKTKISLDTLVAIDNFKTTYFIKNNVFFKKDKDNVLQFNNLQLGSISSANAFNPLKINLFYKDFNTVIILDNRLAEVYRIDFNALPSYKNVSRVSTGHDNTLWLYNQDTQQLELYDYKNNKVRAQTLPTNSTVLDLESNYNSCWLLTKDYLYEYNYFASLIRKISNPGFTSLKEANDNLILSDGKTLSYLSKNTTDFTTLEISKLLINQFFVTNERLYIYSDGFLHHYQLKMK